MIDSPYLEDPSAGTDHRRPATAEELDASLTIERLRRHNTNLRSQVYGQAQEIRRLKRELAVSKN